jgi:hypothetical protein
VVSAERALSELTESLRRAGHLYPEPSLFVRPYRLLAAPDLAELPFEREILTSEAEIASQGGSAEPYVRTVWLMVLCVYGRFDLAFAQSEKLADQLFDLVPLVHVADHTFFRGLAAADLATSARGKERRRYHRVLRDALRRTERWSRSGPDFAPMVALLGAEHMRLRGEVRVAHARFEDAAQRAEQQEYLHLVALAHERRARMLAHRRRDTEAADALAQAIVRYRKWGCEAKALALKRERQETGR